MKTIDLDTMDLASLDHVTGGTAQRIPDIRDSLGQGGTIFNPQPPINLPQIPADKLWPPVS